MSGRGRNNNRNNYSGNRNSGRVSRQWHNRRNPRGGYSGRGKSNNSQSGEIKFVPHYTGKQQVATYDTVKDHIVQQIQRNFKYGNDMAMAIRNMKYDDTNLGGGKPTRQVVEIPDDVDTRNASHMSLQIEQEGFDIEYKEELRKYNL